MLQRFLSRKWIIEKNPCLSTLSRSFLYPRFAKVLNFSKTSIPIKLFREPSDFEICCSKNNFEKNNFEKYWVWAKNYRNPEFLDKFHRLRKIWVSRKTFLYKNQLIMKLLVRFFSKELFQWFRPVTNIDKHHLDITNMLVN